MPEFFTRARDFLTGNQKDTASVNRLVGFQGNGAVELQDRRGTSKAAFVPRIQGFGVSG